MSEIQHGLYPKHHLWGIDGLEHSDNFETEMIKTEELMINRLLERVLNKTFFKGTLGAKIELSALKASRYSSFIYSVCGPLAVAKFVPQKIISWVFRPPKKLSQHYFNSYSKKNLSSQSGFFCLTKKAEEYFSQFSSAKFIPWCVDLDLFDGRQAKAKTQFFLASGKTGRDYETLIKASQLTKTEIRIIGPNKQKPATLPINVRWIDTSANPPDQAIDYPTLRNWYAECIAVCIPLSGEAEDTCGYTNMLEAMAMRKPVVMTRSGSLHIDPESGGFGKLIEPKNYKGWAIAMNELIESKEVAQNLGENGRKIAERGYTIERFNRDMLSFLKSSLDLIEK
jgi:glycosyltransferase involved in cell wall biosynthesis